MSGLEDRWCWGSFWVGALIFSVLVLLLGGMYVDKEYGTLADVEGHAEEERILINCPDGSRQWFPIPQCEGGKE